QRDDDQRRQRAGLREHGAGDTHDEEQDPVATAPPDSVAVAGDEHRYRGRAGQQRGEHGADGGVGEAAPGEGDADQYRAKPVGDGARGLGADDPARVAAQARSSYTAAPSLSGQKT